MPRTAAPTQDDRPPSRRRRAPSEPRRPRRAPPTAPAPCGCASRRRPTGDPHVGTAYMSLFNLAFVRQQGGRFVLRIEDTDRARFREDSEKQVFDTLRWLGLHLGRGPGRRRARARPTGRPSGSTPTAPTSSGCSPRARPTTAGAPPSASTQMREAQQKAKQPTGYDRLCVGKTREERAALPGLHRDARSCACSSPTTPRSTFDDLIRGRVSAPRPDDQVILKADGFPTYHLAVVVDDHEMGITHVVRGEEWISSTPKHVLLYQLARPASRRRSRTCRCCATPTSPRSPSARTPPRGSPGSRSRATCPRRWSTSWRCLPTRRSRAPRARTSRCSRFEEFSRSASTGPRSTRSARSSTSRSSTGSTACYIRALEVDELASRLLPYLERRRRARRQPSRWASWPGCGRSPS